MAPLAILTVLLSACGGDDRSDPDPDAGTDAGTDAAMPMDAGFDAGPVESYLFGPCYTDEQCPGAGGFCRRPADGWPGGYCTAPCMDRAPCDDGFRYNHCLEAEDGSGSFCEMTCLNGTDCGREGYTCVGSFDSMGSGMCIGLCDEDEDCGEVACNEWSGECMPESEIPTGASETGGPCEDDEGCLTDNCIAAYDPSFSGWAGGYCIAFCILPELYNTNTFYGGDTLPQGTCAGEDTVCFPNGSYTRGDLGLCLDGCTTDADCRQDEAYYCLKDFDLPSGDTSSYTNGVCLPLDCRTDECPAGFTCSMLPTRSGTLYRCEPSST